MVGYIYSISNLENGKQYVGKTSLLPEKRWKEHLSTLHGGDFIHRPIYSAMEKYGIDKFEMNVIEKVSYRKEETLSKREVFWIKKLGTYGNGYNATLGGDGTRLFDYEKIRSLFNQYHNCRTVASKIGCSAATVSNVVKSFGLEPGISEALSRKTYMFSKEGEFLREFPSVTEAALYVMKEQNLKECNFGGYKGHISLVCNGVRKTAQGYRWSYTKNID